MKVWKMNSMNESFILKFWRVLQIELQRMVRRFHNHREESIQTKLPVHYDLFASHLSCLNSVLNVKVIVDTFNHKKFLVGAFSVITNLRIAFV